MSQDFLTNYVDYVGVAEIDQWRASKCLDDGYTAALHQVLRQKGVGCRLHRQCIV